MMHYGFGHFGGGIYMGLFWIVLIIGVIYLISRSHLGPFNKNHTPHRSEYRKDYKNRPHRENYQNDNQRYYEEKDYGFENIDGSKDAKEIAKQRYAKGEINKEEYKEILKELKR